jgi:squalene-associated FAD-dependent desaturase
MDARIKHVFGPAKSRTRISRHDGAGSSDTFLIMRTVHVIGAGLAGLSAATGLIPSGCRIVVHEATAYPGGRCRSYHDHATGLQIDNGNHLLLSGNRAVMSYLDAIGSRTRLTVPDAADFPFADLATGARWTLRINDGRLPWWIFDASRRVPGTRPFDYVAMAKLLAAGPAKTVCDVVACKGPLYEQLLSPLIVAALNTDPKEGSAKLAAAVVRESILAGGEACRPLVAHDGLGPVLVEPAIAHLRQNNVTIQFGHEVRAIAMTRSKVTSLEFEAESVAIGTNDAVILAVPPYAAASLVPSLTVPVEFRAILNAHFRVEPPACLPRVMGVLNGAVEWIFSFPGRLSVTVSNADRYMQSPREGLAKTIWQEVSAVSGVAGDLPRWQIVRERRATFAATPEQELRRPQAQTAWTNLFLAGDWTATGLPATIEGAVRSGQRAAQLVSRSNQGW